MNDGKKLAEILLKEYGISTEEELNKAIRNLKPLDISVFCNKKEGEQ